MKAAQDIIIKPIITEHSMEALASGKYTFKVAKDANKIEIAKAVETLFKGEHHLRSRQTQENGQNCWLYFRLEEGSRYPRRRLQDH